VTDEDQWSGSLGEPGTPAELTRARTILEKPVEVLLAIGGDDRQVPGSNERNSYGFPLSDLDPLLRGSSCTATPPDRVALAVADRWRAAVCETIAGTGALPTADALRAPVAEGIVTRLGGDEGRAARVVLTPSGTDTEALVAALALATNSRPLRNILVGAAEAGSGTLLSAAGRQFSTRVAMGSRAVPGELIDGFDGHRVALVDVELRDARGRIRRAFDVEAEVEAHVEHAIECNEQVLIHAMAASKTGVRQLGTAWVRRWRDRYPDHLRVVVDAAQGRSSPAQIRAYLDAGASVAITGSKALCGPPFCGALVLDDALLRDALDARDRGIVLPAGFRDFLSAADLPEALRGLLPGAHRANLGLLGRWTIALDEAERYVAVPAVHRELFVAEVVTRLTEGLNRMPRVQVVPAPGTSCSIVSFMLLDAAGTPLPKAALVEVYGALVATRGVQIGQPVQIATTGAAALRFAVGATTVSRSIEADASPTECGRRTASRALDVLGELLPDWATV
jgi:hypothetical protein